MTNDLDFQLKQVFDERLGRFDAPPRRRRSRSWRRLAVGAAIASLMFAGAGVAVDVNTVAAANGAGCANVLEKVQLWAHSHGGAAAKIDTDRLLAKLAAHGGCEKHSGLKP